METKGFLSKKLRGKSNYPITRPDTIELDCWGTCVTRDIFGMVDNNKFVINIFHQLPFLTSFFPSPDNLQKISFDELSPRPNEGNCWSKWALYDLNREEVEILENSGSKWIVIDLRFLAYNYREVKAGGSSYYFYHGCTDDELRKIFEKSSIKIDSINTVGIESIPDIDSALKNFYVFLKKRYKNNIIVIETREALWKMDKNGTIELSNSAGVERWIRIEEKYFAQALKHLDCFYVKTPPNIIRDDYHKWGIGGVHYIQEYYDYANRCIDIITSNTDDYLKRIDCLFIECTHTFDLIRSKIILSRNNTIRQIEESWKVAETSEEINDLIDRSKQIIEKSNDLVLKAEIQGRIARFYRDRKDGESDLKQAAEWMRKAADLDLAWAKKELADILLMMKTSDNGDQMFSILANSVSAGDNSDETNRDGMEEVKHTNFMHLIDKLMKQISGWKKNNS